MDKKRSVIAGGMGLDSLMEMLGGQRQDEEKDKIFEESAIKALDQLKVIAGGNELALDFLMNMWSDIFEAFNEAKIASTHKQLPAILRIAADTIEFRGKAMAELEARRNAKRADVMKKDNHEH